jgi:parvulin-like peptidyl-prolyl isomerase
MRRRRKLSPTALALTAVAVLLGDGACTRPAAPHVGDAGAARAGARDGRGGSVADLATAGDAGRDPCEHLSAEERGQVVARVGDDALTVCDFAQRIALQNPYLRARFNSGEQRRALLRSWVDSELLAAEARARGLDQDPAVRHAVTSQLARTLENQLRDAVEAPAVSDADVEAYFAQHRAEYDTPEQVRASHVLLPTREAAERVLADARAHAADDAHWRDLVRHETQDDATRDIGGDLGFFTAQGGSTVPPELAAAAFALRSPGDVAAEVVVTAHGGRNHVQGFHVVRFVARREALHRTLDEVRRPIHNRLFRERLDAAQDRAVGAVLEQLRGRTPVTIHDEVLGQLHLDLPDGGTASAPGGPGAPGARGTIGAAGAPSGPMPATTPR